MFLNRKYDAAFQSSVAVYKTVRLATILQKAKYGPVYSHLKWAILIVNTCSCNTVSKYSNLLLHMWWAIRYLHIPILHTKMYHCNVSERANRSIQHLSSMLASHSSDSEHSEPKQQQENLSPVLQNPAMPVQQSEAGTDHAGGVLFWQIIIMQDWVASENCSCVLIFSTCKDLLDE